MIMRQSSYRLNIIRLNNYANVLTGKALSQLDSLQRLKVANVSPWRALLSPASDQVPPMVLSLQR